MKSSTRAIKKALAKEVTYIVEVLDEDTPIEGNALASGDDAEDARHYAWVREQLASGNAYAWCTVKVTAKWRDWSYTDYLGCCSYASKRDFETNCLPDMKAEALVGLTSEVLDAYADIQTLILGTES